MSHPLERLADAYGIQREFRDARGETRRATRETLHALLDALGAWLERDDDAARTLESAACEAWSRNLEPVTVAYADRPIAVDVTLPADTREVAWRLKLEDGEEQRGRASFATLALIDAAKIHGRSLERRRLTLGDVPWGYHRLTVGASPKSAMLIVSPGRCWLPPGTENGRRFWGLAVQLYLLRSNRNWGIGDFTDLRTLVTLLAERGAAVLGLNPLHAMFLDDPEHASPYSPASRLVLNVLNIDVTAAPGYASSERASALVASESFARRLQACREAPLVQYAEVADLKRTVLRILYEEQPRASDAWTAFTQYRQARGETLRRFALFSALREHFRREDRARRDWHGWPPAYREPQTEEVAHFEREHEDEVTFFAWMQWVADEQLAEAARAAGAMPVGLYRDLAVGADPAGVETWSNASAVIGAAHVGAPPDIYNTAGQDWRLPPFHPRALRDEAYRSFVELLRANMRHAGAIRIDHAMALQRLYLIPQNASPAEGAYVTFPLEDLVGILALESQRERCVVIGEDLGTVPEGFRERMAEANILSYRVLFFETDPDSATFLPPSDYPRLALAVIGSHDLPTLRAWWSGADIELKEQLGLLVDDVERKRMREERTRQRDALLQALRREGLVPSHGELDQETLIQAVHAYLARTPSVLAMAQLDDVTGEVDPVNVPATDAHANWRRRLSVDLDRLPRDPRFARVVDAFCRERRR